MIPLDGVTVSLAQCEVLYATCIAQILREQRGSEFPRARLSTKTRCEFSWHITVHARTAQDLQLRGLLTIRLVGVGRGFYENYAVLTDAGRAALATRREGLLASAAAVQKRDAESNAQTAGRTT